MTSHRRQEDRGDSEDTFPRMTIAVRHRLASSVTECHALALSDRQITEWRHSYQIIVTFCLEFN